MQVVSSCYPTNGSNCARLLLKLHGQGHAQDTFITSVEMRSGHEMLFSLQKNTVTVAFSRRQIFVCVRVHWPSPVCVCVCVCVKVVIQLVPSKLCEGEKKKEKHNAFGDISSETNLKVLCACVCTGVHLCVCV